MNSNLQHDASGALVSADDTIDLLRDLLIALVARTPEASVTVPQEEINKAVERFGGRGQTRLMVLPVVGELPALHIWIERGAPVEPGSVSLDYTPVTSPKAN